MAIPIWKMAPVRVLCVAFIRTVEDTQFRHFSLTPAALDVCSSNQDSKLKY
jgi:hypothetical protein